MKQNPFIQVYVLCHNRTQFVKEAVTSALKQNYLNFEVIVSDNSDNNEVFEELNTGDELNKFRYIRRPNLSLVGHQNEILAEVSAPYFMMFHDDDVLQKNALQKLVAGFESDETVAVGANGFILKNTELTSTPYYPELVANKVLSSPEALAEQYLDSSKGVVPFSSYLYKTEVARKNRFRFKEGQSYSSVAFLLKLSASGPVVWLSETLVNIRQHDGNAFTGIDLRATFSFYRFVKKNFKVSEQVLTEFKMKKLGWWSLERSKTHESQVSKRIKTVILKASVVFLFKNPGMILKAFYGRIRMFAKGFID